MRVYNQLGLASRVLAPSRLRGLRVLAPLFLLLWTGACVTFIPQGHPDPAPLATLLTQRLELACEVAWSKQHTGAPVLDPQREAESLAAIQQQAEIAGLPVERVKALFAAQMAASRQVQTELLAAWAAGATPPATPPLDLRRDIRPRLDVLNRQILEAFRPWLTADTTPLVKACSSELAAKGFSSAVAALALEPLRNSGRTFEK